MSAALLFIIVFVIVAVVGGIAMSLYKSPNIPRGMTQSDNARIEHLFHEVELKHAEDGAKSSAREWYKRKQSGGTNSFSGIISGVVLVLVFLFVIVMVVNNYILKPNGIVFEKPIPTAPEEYILVPLEATPTSISIPTLVVQESVATQSVSLPSTENTQTSSSGGQTYLHAVWVKHGGIVGKSGFWSTISSTSGTTIVGQSTCGMPIDTGSAAEVLLVVESTASTMGAEIAVNQNAITVNCDPSIASKVTLVVFP